MAEELEEPEGARRPDAGLFVVYDYRPPGLDAARRQQVTNNPEKGVERRGIGVDEADAEEVEMCGPGDVARRERRGRLPTAPASRW